MSTTGNDRLSCSWMRRATEYACGELGPDARRAFEEHARRCASCRDALEDVEAVRKALLRPLSRADEGHGASFGEPSRYLPRRVLERIPDDAWRPSGGGLRRRVAVSCVLASLLFSAAVVLSLSGRGAGSPKGPDRSVLAADAPDPPGRGGAADDTAISRARAWLLSAQERDGSWDPSRWSGEDSYRVALTGLAVLGLCRTRESAGDDHREGETARVISRAVGYLISRQQACGRFGDASRGALYNHSIALLAVLDGGGVGSSGKEAAPRARGAAVERGVGYLVERQTARGAWGYLGGAAGDDSIQEIEIEEIEENASISFWALQALVRARSYGVDGLEEPLARAGRYFTAETTSGGATGGALFEGRHRCAREPLRGPLVAWSLVVAGRSDERSRAARRALDAALATVAGSGDISFYETYFLARLARNRGSALERRWSEARRELVRRQQRHGPLEGSWDPADPWGPVGGRLYATALAVLALGA